MEKIKNAILLLLVLLSLGQTYCLWFGFPPLEKTEEIPSRLLQLAGEMPPVHYFLLPSSLVLYDSAGEPFYLERCTRQACNFWQEINPVLLEILRRESSPLAVSRKEVPAEPRNTITLEFSPPYPLEIELNSDHRLYFSAAQKIQIDQDSNSVYLFTSEDEIYYISYPAWVGEQLSEIIRPCYEENIAVAATYLQGPLMPLSDFKIDQVDEEEAQSEPGEEEEPFLVAEGNILVPQQALCLPDLIIGREEVNKEELLESIFWDESLARRIEERDGAVFFTDGEKSIRFYEQGGFEFVAPLLEKNSANISPASAILKGAEYISFYGGLPDNTFLEQLELTEEGYRLTWQVYYSGLPLKSKQPALEVLVNEGGLSRYKRNLFLPVSEISSSQQLVNYGEALHRALQIFLEQHRSAVNLSAGKLVLNNIYLGYYLKNQDFEGEIQVPPAWVVEIGDNFKVYLHARTLDLLGTEISS